MGLIILVIMQLGPRFPHSIEINVHFSLLTYTNLISIALIIQNVRSPTVSAKQGIWMLLGMFLSFVWSRKFIFK